MNVISPVLALVKGANCQKYSIELFAEVVQLEFCHYHLPKQEVINACDTNDPEGFYCKRKSNGALRGFEQRRSQLRESLYQLQRDGFSLQKMLLIHSGGRQTSFTQGALIVTKISDPDFFNVIGSGV